VKALVTRPAEDAAPLARALARRGIEAVITPMLSITPRASAARQITDALTGAQAVLFTSANGARVFAAASPRRELAVFSVGDASAAAARIAGFRTVASADGDVEALAALVAARLSPQGGALVHIAGSAVAGDLAGRLAALGFTVRRVVVYDAVAATELDQDVVAALRRGEIALALFFSPRTAATFARLAAAAGVVESCRRMVALALSSAVAESLAALPWRAVRIATAPRQEELLAALDAVLAEEAMHPAGQNLGPA
jgi:uroporphyrinogen-III synthase